MMILLVRRKRRRSQQTRRRRQQIRLIRLDWRRWNLLEQQAAFVLSQIARRLLP